MRTQDQAQDDVREAPIVQERLGCGVTLLAEPMPGYHTASLILRIDGGMCGEPAEQLGLAYVIEEALDKGTARHDARGLADAFDAMGVRYAVHTGRQTWAVSLSALPEFLPRAIELVGEMVCQPTFPADAVGTAVSLTRQELVAIEDSPRALLRREMAVRAYGPVLGRHPLGSAETLEHIDTASVGEHWRRAVRRGALTLAVAGNFELDPVREAVGRAFAALPEGEGCGADATPTFSAGSSHVTKRLEQTQIGLSFAGVPYEHADFPVERVIMAVLSGGMSSRLFTEVREKRGLVYWVGAWHEQPRQLGMVHIGAATTPQRCRETYDALLREVSRIGDDLSDEELERAKVGLVAEHATVGASTHHRVLELVNDHFHLGRMLPAQKKIDAVRAVTIDHICDYLQVHPREDLSVVTVGTEQPAL